MELTFWEWVGRVMELAFLIGFQVWVLRGIYRYGQRSALNAVPVLPSPVTGETIPLGNGISPPLWDEIAAFAGKKYRSVDMVIHVTCCPYDQRDIHFPNEEVASVEWVNVDLRICPNTGEPILWIWTGYGTTRTGIYNAYSCQVKAIHRIYTKGQRLIIYCQETPGPQHRCDPTRRGEPVQIFGGTMNGLGI